MQILWDEICNDEMTKYLSKWKTELNFSKLKTKSLRNKITKLSTWTYCNDFKCRTNLTINSNICYSNLRRRIEIPKYKEITSLENNAWLKTNYTMEAKL